jgi:biopolymer transport protein ExbD
MPRITQSGASPGELSFDMTPMIDVVFQLITFFIVALSFEESQASAEVTLPVADQAKPPKDNLEKELFVFNVVDLNKRKVDGSLVFPPGTPAYMVSGKHVNTQSLRKELDTAAEYSRARGGKKDVESAVIIRGDRDAAWVYVMAAMRECREAGFIKVYLTALEADQPGLQKP